MSVPFGHGSWRRLEIRGLVVISCYAKLATNLAQNQVLPPFHAKYATNLAQNQDSKPPNAKFATNLARPRRLWHRQHSPQKTNCLT